RGQQHDELRGRVDGAAQGLRGARRDQSGRTPGRNGCGRGRLGADPSTEFEKLAGVVFALFGAMMRRFLPVLALGLFVFAAPAMAQTRRTPPPRPSTDPTFGVRAGVSGDPDQFYFG